MNEPKINPWPKVGEAWKGEGGSVYIVRHVDHETVGVELFPTRGITIWSFADWQAWAEKATLVRRAMP